jgi:hydroxyquinol 1,2-dioxygenase
MSNVPPSPYFNEERSEEVVNARPGPAADPRLREVMASVVRHLHAIVKETEPTPEEWMTAIRFLTAVGQKCTDWRQEFILLSDTLGVSMLVETINNRGAVGETESTVLGPFHVSDSPRRANGATIALDGKGEPLVVRGRVLDVDGRPIAGATLDVWQASAEGFYDVQQKGLQPDHNLRGIFTSDAEGRFDFRSAYPRYYPIPVDGPVGDLLQGLDRDQYRPAHIHFIIAAPGYRPVTTHIFPADCPWLKKDAVFGVKESLITDFRRSDDGVRAKALGVTAPFWEVETDFVLSRA